MNDIKGFFQRLKDALVNLLPSEHGNHFADGLQPHMRKRNLEQSRPGGYNTYAGSNGGQQPPSSAQCYQAVSLLRRARIIGQQEALDYQLLIGELD